MRITFDYNVLLSWNLLFLNILVIECKLIWLFFLKSPQLILSLFYCNEGQVWALAISTPIHRSQIIIEILSKINPACVPVLKNNTLILTAFKALRYFVQWEPLASMPLKLTAWMCTKIKLTVFCGSSSTNDVCPACINLLINPT